VEEYERQPLDSQWREGCRNGAGYNRGSRRGQENSVCRCFGAGGRRKHGVEGQDPKFRRGKSRQTAGEVNDASASTESGIGVAHREGRRPCEEDKLRAFKAVVIRGLNDGRLAG